MITGGAGGIGFASARRFHAEGARVVVADIDVLVNNAAVFSALKPQPFDLIDCLPSQGPAKHAPVRSGEYRDLKYAKTGLTGAIAATRSRPTV